MKNTEKYIKFLIYFIVVALLNVAGATLFFRLDLTHNKMYTISEESSETVSKLTEPMTIHAFFTNNLPAPHNTTKRYLADLLKEYELTANKRFFHYAFHDISGAAEEDETSKNNKEMAESYGISPVQIRIIEKDEIKFKNAYMGLVIVHGDLIEKLPALTDLDKIEYTLTTRMKKLVNKISVLNGLDENIKVDFIMSSSLKQVAPVMRLEELPELPENIENTVNKINKKNYGRLSYSFHDPSSDESVKEKFSNSSILTLKWGDMGDRAKADEGNIGLVVSYKENTVGITILNAVNIPIIGTHYELIPMEELESQINGAVETLVDINDKIGYLADHGTVSRFGGGNQMAMQQQSEISIFNTLVAQNYSVKDVNLSSGMIPGDINSLIIANPTEEFSDYELYQIDQALMNGKNLAFFLDSFQEVQPPGGSFSFTPPSAMQPVSTSLEKLLKHYGLTINKSYVMDESCFKQDMQRFGSGEKSIYFAPLIQNQNIDSSLDFMKNIKGLVTLRISPVEADETALAEKGIKATALFSSSAKSWLEKENINLNPMTLVPPRDDIEKKSYKLAYFLEGVFTSYFDGKPIPVKSTEETDEDSKKASGDISENISREGGFINKSKPARILLVASAEMLKDSMIDEQGQSPNATFILNAIDAVNGKDKTALMRGKKQSFNPLDETGPMAKSVLKIFNIAGLPLMVVFFGIIVLLRRKARKKQIHSMFANKV